MKIDVKRVAKLANLELDDEELPKFENIRADFSAD